ncbi:MAG: RidA family protein [Bacteroidota bacterium]|jgi:2-iminobutanoate/2-iminopropanoate deaminase
MKTRMILFTVMILSVYIPAQSKIRIVKTYDAPEAIGPYSQAIESNGFLFLSGQIAIDPSTNQITGNEIEQQTRQIFKNVKAVLKAAGSKISNVVKCTVFMIDLGDFSKMNKIYEEEFEGHRPARSTVQVARLPKDALIEIECIAVK